MVYLKASPEHCVGISSSPYDISPRPVTCSALMPVFHAASSRHPPKLRLRLPLEEPKVSAASTPLLHLAMQRYMRGTAGKTNGGLPVLHHEHRVQRWSDGWSTTTPELFRPGSARLPPPSPNRILNPANALWRLSICCWHQSTVLGT